MSDRVAGLLLAALGGAVALEASTFDVAFMTDPVGPKALPWVAALVMIVGGVSLALRPGASPDWPDRAVRARMAAAVFVFVAYALTLPLAGFFLTTTAAAGSLSVLYGGSARKSVAAAAALSGSLWVLFVQVLDLPLPIGSLWIR